MMKNFFLILLVFFITISTITICLFSNEPVKKRGLTTVTVIMGQPILTCDCTIVNNTDCSCILEK